MIGGVPATVVKPVIVVDLTVVVLTTLFREIRESERWGKLLGDGFGRRRSRRGD